MDCPTGHIGYALAPLVARGVMCGARTPIFLHMHDQAAAAQVLAAVEMEAMDLASHLLLGMPFFFGRLWMLPAAGTAHCDTLVYRGALFTRHWPDFRKGVVTEC